MHKFSEPIPFEDDVVAEIDLAGMGGLVGQDLVDAQKNLPAANFLNVPVDDDFDFWLHLLNKATGKPLEFFEQLPDLEWDALRTAALKAMIDEAEMPEALEEDRYTARAMAKVQRSLTFRENMINYPANNISYCLSVYATLTGESLAALLERRAGTAMMIFLQVRNHFFGLARLPAKKSPESSGGTAST